MSAKPLVFEATPETFQADVIERSSEVPVVVLFWAAQVPEAVAAKQVLDSHVNASQGKLALALVDVATDQSLAQHLRVQTLPSIRVVRDGQMAEQLDGPQPDEALQALCSSLTMSGAEVLQEQLAVHLEKGDFESALALLQRAIEQEPTNGSFRVELADILILQGNLDDARTVLAGISQDTQELERPKSRLAFAEEAEGMATIEVLEGKCAQDEKDLASRYDLAVRYISTNRAEEALDTALDILCSDRKFRDDIGRLTMLRIFDVLPKGSELASSFRRRMFNFMH